MAVPRITPITLEEVLAKYPNLDASRLLPFPSERPLTEDTVLKLLTLTTEVANLWLPGSSYINPEDSFFSSEEYQRAICMQLVQRDVDFKHRVRNRARGRMALDSLESQAGFMISFGGEHAVHYRRSLIRLMFDAQTAARMLEYIKSVVNRMLRSSRDFETVKLPLVAGMLDFEKPGVTAWIRARTVLLAKHYELKIRLLELGIEHTNPHAHFSQLARSLSLTPSLTSRQARRSGVSAEELRARWA